MQKLLKMMTTAMQRSDALFIPSPAAVAVACVAAAAALDVIYFDCLSIVGV
jgi:hypothetical protein